MAPRPRSLRASAVGSRIYPWVASGRDSVHFALTVTGGTKSAKGRTVHVKLSLAQVAELLLAHPASGVPEDVYPHLAAVAGWLDPSKTETPEG